MNSLGKNTLIACAVASALGSSAALALPPSATIEYTLYAAGGSAQANAFFVAASKLLTNVDSYTDATGGADSGSYRVLTGTTGSGVPGVASGKNVMYFYKFNGGSYANGVQPQAPGAGSSLLYPRVADVQAATAISGATAGTGVPTYAYTDTGRIDNSEIPDWGIADVEVGLFRGYNNPTGNAGGTAINTNGGAAPSVGATDGIYDNLFGVAVTANVYNGTGPGNPKTNFSRAEVAGILQGTISDWSQLFDDTGAQMQPGGIIFLDRGEGSGTKASGNQYFLGYPGDGSSAKLPNSATTAYTATSLGSNTESTCYCDIAESSTSNVVADLLKAQAAGQRAIAVLGLENPPALHQVGGANPYYFTSINGVFVDTNTSSDNLNGTVATSYINVVKGNYDFYYQNSFNTRTATNTSTVPAAFASAFKTTFTSAGFVGADAGTAFPSAVPGTLLDPDNGSTITKGKAINSRNKVSTGPLLPVINATSAGIPVSKEPL